MYTTGVLPDDDATRQALTVITAIVAAGVVFLAGYYIALRFRLYSKSECPYKLLCVQCNWKVGLSLYHWRHC